MPKVNSSISFKNMEFRVTQDEVNGQKEIWLVEYLKDEEVYTNFNEILERFLGEEGISMTIKVEKGGMEDQDKEGGFIPPLFLKKSEGEMMNGEKE